MNIGESGGHGWVTFNFFSFFLFLSSLDSVRRRILLLKHVILVLELIDRS